MILLDTCVLIDYLRDRMPARAYLESLEQAPLLSALTVAELYAGVRDGEERSRLEALFHQCPILPVTAAIARQGGLYRRDYHKSHGVGIVDAVLAATAESAEVALVTLNRKHFPMLEQIIVPY